MMIIISGPPLAGKSTLSRTLAREIGNPRISSGDLIRDGAANGDLQCVKLLHQISDGSLADTASIIDVVTKRLSSSDCEHGFVLDGFPRRLPEVTALMNHIVRSKLDTLLICLTTSESVIRHRARIRALRDGRADDLCIDRRLQLFKTDTLDAQAEMKRHLDFITIESTDGVERRISDAIIERSQAVDMRQPAPAFA